MRLNKYIARSGVTSRRKADYLIETGQVSVNGVVVTDFMDVTDKDEVVVGGKKISLPDESIIIAVYKPSGVMSTLSDRFAKKTIDELLPADLPRLNPVGRLDMESEGLLLMTNDGELHHELTHPSFEHEKEYEVHLERDILNAELEQLRSGVELEEGMTPLVEVQRLAADAFSIVLKQGWNRQIRRMVGAVNNRVTLLKRVRIGKLQLDTMQPGETRVVTRAEIL